MQHGLGKRHRSYGLFIHRYKQRIRYRCGFRLDPWLASMQQN
ncbi:hypothetical protein ACVWWP_007273 [Bradyrhizobium sp. LM3.6]